MKRDYYRPMPRGSADSATQLRKYIRNAATKSVGASQ